MKKIITTFYLLATVMASSAQSIYPGQFTNKLSKPLEKPMSAYSFQLKDVRLLPSRFRDNMLRDSAWMCSIDTKRLLHSFRTNAGVFTEREGGYTTMKKLGGWESLDCDLRGHTTGHLLSAYALMYASTGSEIFKLKGDSLVAGLAGVQQALHAGGYLSAFPEGLIDRNIDGQGVWAPWYTLHKLYSGLIDQYLYCDNNQAFVIVKGMGDWAYNKLQPLSDETRRKMIRNEFGGMNESFYNLYAITGDERYHWLAEFFYHNEMIDPLNESKDELAHKHANTFIPKVIAEARNYELNGILDSRKKAEYFWENVTHGHSFVTGSNSDKEKFFDHSHLSDHLSGYTGETCCTYNMLKLSRHLFCWSAQPEVADYYERALYNHILGQQDPATGMVVYFLPMETGAFKVYSTPENSFWCCVGTGFESHAKYAEAIYYHSADALFVNLFIPSEVNWKEKAVKVRQETSFPADDRTTLLISTEKQSKFDLKLRYPSWSGKPIVKINGRRVKVSIKPNSYITIERTWKNDDRVEVCYPMSLHLETTPDNASRAAFMYGPLVLAGELGTEGMTTPAPYSDPSKYNDYYTYDYQIPAGLPVNLDVDVHHLHKMLTPTDRPLRWITNTGVTVAPLYDVHRQRYVVYWNLIK